MGELHDFQQHRARSQKKETPQPRNPVLLLGLAFVTATGLYFVYAQASEGKPALDAALAYVGVCVAVAAIVAVVRSMRQIGRFMRHRTALKKLEAEQAELKRLADQGSSISRIKLLQTPTRDPRKIPWREW